jgi:hypothetical protein
MKEYLASLVQDAPTPGHGRNVAREYLQARILAGLQRGGAMIPLAFHGGTALRFLYRTPRYSEDLDFSLERDREAYALRDWLHRVSGELESEGYGLDVRLNDRRTVHSAWLRFRGLYNELGLSPHRDETLAIKLEVDTRPPAGVGLATTVVRRYVLLHLQHHDRPSLLAGKLHAVLQRPYTKGRDLYDLFWYLSDPQWPGPNLTLLNNALAQTGWAGEPLTEETWPDVAARRLADTDWDHVQADVRPFLEQSAEADLLTHENMQRLLAERRS